MFSWQKTNLIAIGMPGVHTRDHGDWKIMTLPVSISGNHYFERWVCFSAFCQEKEIDTRRKTVTV